MAWPTHAIGASRPAKHRAGRAASRPAHFANVAFSFGHGGRREMVEGMMGHERFFERSGPHSLSVVASAACGIAR